MGGLVTNVHKDLHVRPIRPSQCVAKAGNNAAYSRHLTSGAFASQALVCDCGGVVEDMGGGTRDVFYVYDNFIVLLINNNYIVAVYENAGRTKCAPPHPITLAACITPTTL